MGVALAVAILVALVVQAKFSSNTSTASGSSVEVLVAKKSLAVGEKITEKDVRWQAWPEDNIFKGMIRKDQQEDEKKLSVYDTPLRRNIENGEPITTAAIIADLKGGNSFLAASIAPGMRAMAISVKPDSSVGGFISPGDYVDVVLSYAPNISSELQPYSEGMIQRYASQTVLSNIKVLAVDQEAKDEEREAKVAKTVTLELTKQGTEILALATNMGDISLSLRRLGEKDTPRDRNASITTDATTMDVLKKIMGEMQKTNSRTVRVYSGTNIENVPVRMPATP